MATYKQIQEYIKKEFGFSCKSCWIAHMKELCNLPVQMSPRRIMYICMQNNNLEMK
ncbi:MAG: hypothetical protein Q4D65_09450 [Peptostreptococcaceae bacterium]|nr:hypothetical protein [Peptostreptococcaceae bacterium]